MVITKTEEATIKNYINYDPDTGFLTWKFSRGGRVEEGQRAGCLDKANGYRKVSVDSKRYLEHTLAWFLSYGYIPENKIMHINDNKQDNRLCNLRDASHSCCLKNQKRTKKSNTGITGVYMINGKYVVYSPGRNKYFKTLKTLSEAVKIRLFEEVKCNYSECVGESPAHKYMVANG